MEYQAIVIDDLEEKKNKRAKSQPNTASSSQVKMNGRTLSSSALGNEVNRSRTWSSRGSDEYVIPETMESLQQEERAQDEAEFQCSLRLIERRLEERNQLVREEGLSSSICIFRLPHSLAGIDNKAQFPEIVSIGPYHRGEDQLLKFEDHKWSFLNKVLSRTSASGRDLSLYLTEMRQLEERTRRCYSDVILMSSHDFIEMMLLDGFFVVELLRHLGCSKDFVEEDDPIFGRPWLIPILIKDLLKLENQLPFFVLESLFSLSKNQEEDSKMDYLPTLALQVFDLAFPRPSGTIPVCCSLVVVIKHLLHLFYLSLLPPNPVISSQDLERYRPSITSIQCATQLRPSGIKFKTKKEANTFLDIEFKNRVLEIPAITVNDFTSTLLLNCVALEQCEEDNNRYFTDYVYFMNCLVKQPRDVAFLCLDGIITRFSQDDLCVTKLFNSLAKDVAFNVRSCYLCKQFRDVEAYYSSNWATMMRTYFSTPWSFISVFSAFLIIVLTMVQTIMSILSYLNVTPQLTAT